MGADDRVDPHEERESREKGGRGPLSRRHFLGMGAAGVAGLAAAGGALAASRSGQEGAGTLRPGGRSGATGGEHVDLHGLMESTGELRSGGFDPAAFLTDFDGGRESRLPSGQVLREYEIVATDVEIEVAPGVFFPAWAYNGQVPGPTIRCTEGDRLRVHFSNAGSHPHTIHFHGIHAADMDGVFEVVPPGGSYVYEFDAEPAGMHLYHCHAIPLKRHIHKGLYGAFIIDPPGGRPPARELVMVMNGFDTNLDGENEVYAVNTVAFHYQKHPIVIEKDELVRVYLANLTEFDPINSFHLHGNFFRFQRTGTRPEQYEWTDNVMMCQGERGVLEFEFRHTGRFMFHAHQSEFAELGWMGMFDVRESGGV